MSTTETQWDSIRPYLGAAMITNPTWAPEHERIRLGAYKRYDDFYWNTPKQFALRVLDGEEPVYIPSARTIVDTTSHYLLKGLELTLEGTKADKEHLDNFLKREAFFSRFHAAKQAGVARGDYVFHMTANPSKARGTRISLNSVQPEHVFPIYDEHEPDLLIGCHIAVEYEIDSEPGKIFLNRLTYRVEEVAGEKRISREQAIYELDGSWFSKKAKKIRQVLKPGLLDARIQTIPIYWFKNREWMGEDFGSSELRGVESMFQAISQGATDVNAALSLEGLGVYATDGGRPVDEKGNDTDWEVAPGRVMEVPSGAYFRRVEGIGTITPATDQINYLEDRINRALGISDVALGNIDSQTAQSGIALAIKFIPTLAKIETRDSYGIDILTQMFFDWKTWYAVFEQVALDGDIIPSIGDKLPTDRTAKVNELNNMLDRRVISTEYYRTEMEKLGYTFPKNIQDQIDEDLERAKAAQPEKASNEDEDDESNKEDTLEDKNKSNNKDRPNESSGTEADDEGK